MTQCIVVYNFIMLSGEQPVIIIVYDNTKLRTIFVYKINKKLILTTACITLNF